MNNRKAAEAVVLDGIEALLPGGDNTQIYKDMFAEMSNAQFDAWMERLAAGEIRLAIIAPNMDVKNRLTVERNLALAEKWGHQFFERLRIDYGNEVPVFLTPMRYLVVQLSLRRQAQLLVKKTSIPVDNKSIDDYTGQPTGQSKGSKLSYPEMLILASHGLDESTTEMIKYRGGDVKGLDAMNTAISKSGGVSLKSIEHLGTKVKSTQTLRTFLLSMHLENTL